MKQALLLTTITLCLLLGVTPTAAGQEPATTCAEPDERSSIDTGSGEADAAPATRGERVTNDSQGEALASQASSQEPSSQGQSSDCEPQRVETISNGLIATVAGPGRPAEWVLADENTILSGYSDRASFSVELPAGWIATEPATLMSNVAASEIARNDMSLRFDVAGRPVGTWTLDDNTSATMPIATEALTTGFTLEALTTTPILEELECRDPQHVGRWVDIGKPTIQASIAPDAIDVARAIRGLGPISQLTGEPLSLVIPEDPSPEVLEIIGSVTAAIGHHGAPVGWKPVRAPKLRGRSGVIIAPEPGDPATVTVEVRGLDVVVTLHGDERALVDLAQALSDPDRLLYFHDESVTIADVPLASPHQAPEVFRFHDAGYDDRTLRGNGAKSLIYRIHIPAGVPPDSATVALFATYMPALAAQEATVSVRINGSEEKIVALLDDSGQLEVLHSIASADLRPGLNFVKVTVQFGDRGAGSCSTDESLWFTVSSESALGTDNEEAPRGVKLGVEDARFALAEISDFNQADVVVADNPDNQQIAEAASLIGQLAQRGQGGSPRLVTDTTADTTRHLVVVGKTGDRPLLKDLPVQANGSVGVVAAAPSPYTDGRVMLAFAGATEAVTQRAIEAGLSSEVNDIESHYVLVGLDNVYAPGNTASLDARYPETLAYAEEADEPPSSGSAYEDWILEQSRRIEVANQPQSTTRRAVSVGLLLAVGLVVGFFWIQRSRRADVAGGHD